MIGRTQAGIAAPSRGMDSDGGPRCTVCPHNVPVHDVISLRFCHATQANALTRNCVCPTSG
jgi:hypothetical protein